jgi:hypothetical protein
LHALDPAPGGLADSRRIQQQWGHVDGLDAWRNFRDHRLLSCLRSNVRQRGRGRLPEIVHRRLAGASCR